MSISLDQLRADAALHFEARKAKNKMQRATVANIVDEFYDDGCSEWERTFLKSVLQRLDASETNTLSEKQETILLNIPADVEKRRFHSNR